MGTPKRRDLKPGTVFRYMNGTGDNSLYMAWDSENDFYDLKPNLPEEHRQAVGGSKNPGMHPDADVQVTWAPPEAEPVVSPVKAAPLLTQDKKARKEMPIARGVVDYFPRALAAIANVSFVANQQHNPGEPMHWDKSKSTDHADCIARHLIERGTVDDDGLRHSAKLAWRALALLETELSEQK